jgi:membrane associated rhomboid family serine protease
MHAGIIHFLMNMLTHLRLGVDLERALGTPRYVFLYMAAGIWGFVLSGMLSQNLSGMIQLGWCCYTFIYLFIYF